MGRAGLDFPRALWTGGPLSCTPGQALSPRDEALPHFLEVFCTLPGPAGSDGAAAVGEGSGKEKENAGP